MVNQWISDSTSTSTSPDPAKQKFHDALFPPSHAVGEYPRIPESQSKHDPSHSDTKCGLDVHQGRKDDDGGDTGDDEEPEEDDEEDDEGNAHQPNLWPDRRLPEEREVSPDDDEQPSGPLIDPNLRSNRDGLSHPSRAALNSVDIRNYGENPAEYQSIASALEDSEDAHSIGPVTRDETAEQEVNSHSESHSRPLTVPQAIDATLTLDTQREAKLDDESDLFGDPTVSFISPHKLHPPEHVDSSTVAIPPVFQAVPAHIPSNFYATRSHPWNRSGFRYVACGPAPPMNERNINNDHLQTPARYLVYYTIQTIPEGQVKWAWEDRSSYVYITKDGLSVTTDRGFRSARANIPIREGRFYFEIILDRAGGEVSPGSRSEPEHAHVRLGLARRESALNAPVGIDGYSYGIRDKTGEKVHLSKLEPYGDQFGTGDVIGVYVDLPPMRTPDPDEPDDPARIQRRRIPIRYRRQLYFESPEFPISKEMEDLAEAASPSKLKPKPDFHSTLPAPPAVKKPMPGQKHAAAPTLTPSTVPSGLMSRDLPVLKGSKLAFFKNGVCQGVAFEDLLDFLPLKVLPNSSPDKANPNLVGAATDDLVFASSHLHTRDLHDDGTLGYYPCVSVYGGGIARMNPGPEFQFPPPQEMDAYLSDSNQHQSFTIAPQASTTHQLKEATEPNTDKYTTSRWQPLSALYSIYMAQQLELDKLDAAECQHRVEQELRQAKEAEKQTLKRRRAPSPLSRPLSPSGTNGTSGTKGLKPKKKSKTNNGNHVNTASINSQRSQSFKPSPLGLTEVFNGSTSAVDSGSSPPALTSNSQSFHPSSLLGLTEVIDGSTSAVDLGSSPPALTSNSQSFIPSPLGRVDVFDGCPSAVESGSSPPALKSNPPPPIGTDCRLGYPAQSSDSHAGLALLSAVVSGCSTLNSNSVTNDALDPDQEPGDFGIENVETVIQKQGKADVPIGVSTDLLLPSVTHLVTHDTENLADRDPEAAQVIIPGLSQQNIAESILTEASPVFANLVAAQPSTQRPGQCDPSLPFPIRDSSVPLSLDTDLPSPNHHDPALPLHASDQSEP